ncbi:hypothetical protein Tco_1215053 [Tanacetum coccineum]
MTTLAEYMIVVGAENRPPMLDKSMYNSWESHMLLYIKGNKNGRMMLESIKNGPLVYPTIEEDVKDIWEIVKLLMKGTELSYPELNVNCTISLISLLQSRVITKFVNALQPEWSKFVTDVKLAKNMYNTNYDQLYAYLSQNEGHANEVRVMRERYPDPLALVANSQRLAVASFLLGDDPIACLNKEMEFMSTVMASHFPSTNNQLRTSSNSRNQATIQDGRVTVQQVQGRYYNTPCFRSMRYKTKDTLVVATLEVVCIKDLVALHFGDLFVMRLNLCILNNEQVKFQTYYQPQTHIPLRPNLGVLQIGIKSQGYREPDIVMSDSEDSTVTYTAVSSPFEGLSNIRSPGVDGLPMMPEDLYAYVVAAFQAPPSPDYVPGLEEPEQAPPLPEFVPEPEDPEEDDDEDPEEDPTDYPTDRDNDDNEEEEPSRDEADDEDEDDDEEEEHLASADSVPPLLAHHTIARISIPAHALVPFFSEEETPSPPLPVSPPLPISPPPLPASPTYPLGFKAAMIRQRAKSPSTSHLLPLPPPIILLHTRASVSMMRAAAPSTYILASRSETPPSRTSPLLPISLPTPSPPFSYPLLTVERIGLRANYGFVATLDAEIRRDPERDVGYGITNTWDEMIDTYEFYGRLDKAQDARGVLSGWFNLLQRDRCSHSYTALLMEREARLSREAWGRSMAASDAARFEVIALRTTVLGQQAEIVALRVVDHARQAQLVETLSLVSTLQTQVITLQG